MNRMHSTLVAVAALVAAAPSLAQDLPAPSPAARVMQRVGLTDVTVEYSSPGAKGRTIWGDLVPYDAIWRTGANAVTKITFSGDVTFGGKAVAAGTYSLLTLPTKGEWTVVLSKDLTFFAGGKPYDDKSDVARVTARTTAIPHRERMTFVFADTTDDGASLDLEWEKLRVSVPIVVDTKTQALANIDKAIKGASRPFAASARWLGDNTTDYDTALKYADQAIAIDSSWFNNWIKATLLAKKGKWADARKYAKIAWDLGEKSEMFFFRDQVKQALEDWKKK